MEIYDEIIRCDAKAVCCEVFIWDSEFKWKSSLQVGVANNRRHDYYIMHSRLKDISFLFLIATLWYAHLLCIESLESLPNIFSTWISSKRKKPSFKWYHCVSVTIFTWPVKTAYCLQWAKYVNNAWIFHYCALQPTKHHTHKI